MKILINNEVRKALRLSLIQYSVMECIVLQSSRTGFTKPKESIASMLDLSINSVYGIISTLTEKKLLNKSNGGRVLMPTKIWKDMFTEAPIKKKNGFIPVPTMNDFYNKQDIECYFDGACEPINPGGNMGMGWIIVNTETGHVRKRKRYKKKVSTNSNNVAEYLALYLMLKDFREYDNCNIRIYGDSRLVVDQVTGVNPLTSGLHHNIAKRTIELLAKVSKTNVIKIKWIPRELNTAADSLAKEALETLHDSKTKR